MPLQQIAKLVEGHAPISSRTDTLLPDGERIVQGDARNMWASRDVQETS